MARASPTLPVILDFGRQHHPHTLDRQVQHRIWTLQRTLALLWRQGHLQKLERRGGQRGVPRHPNTGNVSSVCVCGTVRFVPFTEVYGSGLSGIKCSKPQTVFTGLFFYIFSWQVRIPHYTETQRPVVSGQPQVKPSLCPILHRGQLDTSQTESPRPRGSSHKPRR